MVWDFFKNLARQKMTGIQAQAKGKVMGAQAKAKMKASAKVNQGLKGAANKAKGAAKKKAAGGGQEKDQPAAQKKDEGMGLFGKGKKQAQSQPAMAAVEPEAASFGDKTQFIQVMEEPGTKSCVGWLVALNGALKGQDFRIVDGKNMIGTAADADIVLTDQYMSSRHAVLRHEEGMFVLVDLDSTNGTYVNETRVSKEELIDNDRVRLGRTELKFKSLY